MRPYRMVPVVMLVLVAACHSPAPAGRLSKADEQALRATTDSFAQRVRRADWPGAAAVYAKDAHFMPPNQPAVVGRDAILAWMKVGLPISSFELTVDEVNGRGDVAYLRGRYIMTFTPAGVNAPRADTGKYLQVQLRQTDGSWAMLADIFNSDRPTTR